MGRKRGVALSDLNAALSAYEAALADVASAPADKLSIPLLAALLARDGVAQALVDAPASSAEALARLTDLDGRLKDNAPVWAGGLAASFAGWREAVRPPARSWWWFLDERIARKPSVIFTILSGLFFTLAISLVADVSRRFLSGGSDFIGLFSTVSQALLALAAGSSLTNAGREQIERTLARFGVPRHAFPLWKTGLGLMVVLIMLGVRVSLPSIAVHYNDQGVRQQNAGQITSALISYQRAINLYSDYAQAHYNLATAYEDVLDWDKALAEYQVAVRANPQLYFAYNNLARLYMLRRNDFANALAVIDQALSVDSAILQQPAVRYSLLKNRGWAYIGLKLYALAEAELTNALALQPRGAAAHCLLGQVFEARGAADKALPEWEACLRYAGEDTVEQSWLALARERIIQSGSK
jgi:tetratricopeptide (TPR) repeat protein